MSCLKHNSRGSVIVCYLLLGLLLACTPVTSENSQVLEIDDGFFSGNPCGPPCFWNIVPGVTTEAEAMRILQDKGFQNCETFDNEDQGGIRGISCCSSTNICFRPYIGINFQRGSDIVEGIGFNPFHNITVGEVISKHGEPDAIFVAEIGIPEVPKVGMSFYYDDLQTDLNLPEQEGIIFRVEASTEVESISYSASYRHQRNRFRDFQQEWKGYGEYRDIFD